MVSAPRLPPSLPSSPLHCAGPVAIVTGLSDRWPSYRYGVLNSPTASPKPPSSLWVSAANRGRSKSPCLDSPSLVHSRSLSDHTLWIYSNACFKSPVQTRGTHTALRSIVNAPAESGTAELATHQRNSITSFPHPPEVCSSVTSCWLMQSACPQNLACAHMLKENVVLPWQRVGALQERRRCLWLFRAALFLSCC